VAIFAILASLGVTALIETVPGVFIVFKIIGGIAGIFAAFMPPQPPAHTPIFIAIIAFVIDFSWYAVVALTLSSQRSKSVYERAKTNFDRVASIFLAAVGLRLLFT